MDYSRPGLPDRLAGDYVAGTLRGGARRRFETLLLAHPSMRAAVDEWESRLMPLTAGLQPEAPPPALWKRIESRIGPAAVAPAARAPWWDRLGLWRAVSALASLAAIGLAVLLAHPEAARPPVIVVLTPTGAPEGAVVPASFVAGISSDGSSLVTRPLVNVRLEANRSLELWALPASGTAPRSLGLISARGATVLKRPEVLKGAGGLAVSLEPEGGSPTGAPTGPVLYAGKLTS
jgi:anti-sigma-K factor RskA